MSMLRSSLPRPIRAAAASRWLAPWVACLIAAALQASLWAQAPAASSPAPAASAPQAVLLAGVHIEPNVALGGAVLPLHGAGIRSRFFIKVYTAALYAAGHADSAEALLALPGPKRIQITMLRAIDGNELGRLFTQGMEHNTPRESLAQSINGTLRMGELFARRKRLLAGDSFCVDWLPGLGARVLINGKTEIDTIPEPEFFAALLGIWLGKSPADDDLKAALLGKTGPRRNTPEP